eukprot:6337621-Amphidinium_carterae.1
MLLNVEVFSEGFGDSGNCARIPARRSRWTRHLQFAVVGAALLKSIRFHTCVLGIFPCCRDWICQILAAR